MVTAITSEDMNEITSHSVVTYWARIFLGCRRGYSGTIVPRRDVMRVVDQYCDEVGLCVTVTKTAFRYSGGEEPGMIIELINYPRSPRESHEILKTACDLAKKLKIRFDQNRISVMTPDATIMFGEKDD